MIASLPMYQRAELVEAHDRYWQLIRSGLADRGVDSPRTLAQDADEFTTWRDPSLVLSQTCGMPYRNDLHGRVALVGTPDFGVEECEPGFYRSVFVVRADDERAAVEDFADAVFSYNQNHSQSGYSAAYHHVAALGFWFPRRFHAGQHRASAQAVADGDADIASLDAVTWRLIEQHDAVAARLRVIDWTAPSPGLPYIAAPESDAGAVFSAVEEAIDRLDTADRRALGLRGIVAITADTYLQVPNPPTEVTADL